MKVNLLTFLGTILLLASCGTKPREVRYVYVNPPRESAPPSYPSYQSRQEIESTPQTYQREIAQEENTTRSRVRYSTPRQEYHRPSPKPQRKRLTRLERCSQEDCIAYAGGVVEGCYRGYGEGRADDFIEARDEAELSATEHVLKKFLNALKKAQESNRNRKNSQTIKTIIQKAETGAIAAIGNVKTIAYGYKRGPMNEYYVCVEVKAEDIISNIRPFLEKFTQQEQLEIENLITKQTNE